MLCWEHSLSHILDQDLSRLPSMLLDATWHEKIQWPHGLTAHGSWPHGLMASWPHGPMASWPHGPMASWQHGLMASGPYGLMAHGLWAHGLMGSWPHGLMAAWHHGMASWPMCRLVLCAGRLVADDQHEQQKHRSTHAKISGLAECREA